VLASLDGLNRTQQRAIATALSSSFTLWQARLIGADAAWFSAAWLASLSA
jgi:hypothetical protein